MATAKKHRIILAIGVSAGSVLVAPVTTADTASAEPSSNLADAVTSIRAASSCPPLQQDPLVKRAAEMAAQETIDYVGHRTAAVPFSDPVPALRTIGHSGAKGVLLSGYGSNERDALTGLILQGPKDIADCTYTQFGASTRWQDGFVYTAVVLAHP